MAGRSTQRSTLICLRVATPAYSVGSRTWPDGVASKKNTPGQTRGGVVCTLPECYPTKKRHHWVAYLCLQQKSLYTTGI